MQKTLLPTFTAAFIIVAVRAQAQTSLVKFSLNLRYNDPADPAEGGRWYLVARTDDANGIGSFDAYLTNVDAIGVIYGSAAGNGYPFVNAEALGATVDGTKPLVGVTDNIVHLVYIQDLENGPIVLNVGRGDAFQFPVVPGEVHFDPFGNVAWYGASVLMSGPFGANRPEFATSGGNATNASVFTANNTTPPVGVTAASVTMSVRGDSVTLDGLFPGDASRNGWVNSDDFSLMALNFGRLNATWDQGNFNDTERVDADDFNLLAVNFGRRRTPPGVAAAAPTPEPATSSLLLIGLAAFVRVTRRQAS
jgi:hypothetical protein